MLWQRNSREVGGQRPAAGDSGLEHRDPGLDDPVGKLLHLVNRGSVPLRVRKLREGVAPALTCNVRVDASPPA
jgi:hypothetical protein